MKSPLDENAARFDQSTLRWREAGDTKPTPGRGAQKAPRLGQVRPVSELDTQACCRGDVLGRLEAVREPAIDVRNHYTRVEVNPLDRPPVDQGGEGVLRASAFVA